MAKPLVSDELWAIVEPLLPPTRAPGTRGPPPVPNRVALTGILFVLKTGLPWEYFPQELGCCGMTLWNRLRDWQRAGVWERLHRTLLQHLAAAGQIDWRRASADASRIPAKGVKKQLSCMSSGGCLSGGLPGDPLAQHRVEDEQELVHGGGESDLLRFSGGEQPLVEGPEDGIVPHGYQGAHIQGGSYAGAAAPDDAPPP